MNNLQQLASIYPIEEIQHAPISFFTGTHIKANAKPEAYSTLHECFQSWEDPQNTSLVNLTNRLKALKPIDKVAYKKERSRLCPTYQIGRWNTRKECETYVPVLVFDIDGGDDATYLFNLSKCEQIPFIYRMMPSLGGGVRILIKCGSNPDTHKLYYKALSKLLGEWFDIPVKSDLRGQENGLNGNIEHIDSDTSALNQFWFACHTPSDLVYHNEESEVFQLLGENDRGMTADSPIVASIGTKKRPQGGGYKVEFSQREKIENLVWQIEEKAEDLTRGITQTWFPKILLPLANEFGQNGRDLAHRISRFHPDYKQEETDQEFDKALAKDRGQIKIGTFYQICKSAGYLVDFDRLKAVHNGTNGHNKKSIQESDVPAVEIEAPEIELDPDHPNLTIDRDQNCYWWESTGKGKTRDRISNFIIKPHYLLLDSQEPKRIWELTNNRNESTVICIPARYLAKQAEFTAQVEGRGNFVPSWSGKQFSAIKEYLFPQEKQAEEISTLGYQPATNHYAFARGVFDQKSYQEADEYGIVKANDQLYYLPAFSIVNDQAEREFHNERKFLFEPGKTTFKAWSEQLIKVFGDNAKVGICFTVAALFRDIIFAHANCFPILFLFGPRGTGKTTYRQALKRLFGKYGPNDAIGLGSASSPKGFARKLAQVRNGLEAFEEYKNRINTSLIEMLKNIYDGIGYERAQTTNDNRTHATPVNSAVIVAGQEMPTKENALFSRVILLSFANTSHSEEGKKEFRKLEQMIDQGLGNVLLEIIAHREQMVQEFSANFNKVYSHLRKDQLTQHLEERSLTNVAALLAPLLVLSKSLAFPIDYKEAYRIFRDRITTQHDQMSKSNEVNQFWRIFDFLVSKGEIPNRFKVSEDKKVLYLRLDEVHPKYIEQGKKQDATLLDRTTLESYLTMQPYFIRPQGRRKFQQRFEPQGGPKYCIAFDLTFLELENL